MSFGWQQADIVVKGVGSVLVPVALLLIGQGYNRNQARLNKDQISVQRAADEQREKADRLTLLLQHLGSTDSRQRLLAITVAEYYAKSDQLPPEIVPVLVGIAKNGTPQEVAAAHATLQALPPTVYIHIQNEAQRPRARALQAALQGRGISAPGIERRPAGPNRPELRYFRSQDKTEGEELASFVVANGIPVRLANLSDRFSDQAGQLAHHFEVWFGPGPPPGPRGAVQH